MSPQTSPEVRLPRPPGVIRRAFAVHPVAVDVTIVAFYLFGSVLMALLDLVGNTVLGGGEGGFGAPLYLTWPLVIATVIRVIVVSAALFFRRRFPLLGLIVVSLLAFGEQGSQTAPNGVALAYLLYAIPVFRSVRAGWVGFVIALLASVAQSLVSLVPGISAGVSVPGVFFSVPGTLEAFFGLLFMNSIWMLAVLLLGINIGNRRRYVEAIIDRAHQLARERDQLALLAVAEERSRIAREMHDIVAHSVSVMIALSEGAARAATAAPEAAADAMQRSAETGRTALAEMRRLLGALHSPEDSLSELVPQPGVDDLATLVRGFTEAGLRVSLRVEGEAAGDRGQELAVYRIAQEGLTNVLRYAGHGATAEVTVSLLQEFTVVEVRDHGRAPGVAEPVSGVGSGRGLAGLAERVRVFGGSIESGRVPVHEGTGWRVRAVLPVNADARETGRLARNTLPAANDEGERND